MPVEDAVSLWEMLDGVAARHPSTTLRFRATDESLTYSHLARLSSTFAEGLRRIGVAPGELVGLHLPTCADFVTGLFGIFRSGAVASPLPPAPTTGRVSAYQDRIRAILRDGAIRRVIVPPDFDLTSTFEDWGVTCLLPAQVLSAGAAEGPVPDFAPPEGRSLALVQYTSGSTSIPKGVALSHANVLGGIEAIVRGIALGPEDVNGQWLPLHHDMGLIGLLAGIHAGVAHQIWSPFSFIRSPARWLMDFAASKATIYAGPNFSYAQMLARVRDSQLAAMDLSAWRVAFNGAEPIDPACVERFLERFGPAGFRPETMFPVYGLAEATLAATFPRRGERPRVDWVDRDALANERRAVPTDRADARARGVLSVGRAVPGAELQVTDDEGVPLPPGRVGNILLRGASVMASYHRRSPEESGLSPGGWLRTGDLGYLSGGDLFVCGRAKDVVIVRGTNYYPEDVEWALGGIADIHRGRRVAVGIGVDSDDRLAVLVEMKTSLAAAAEELAHAVQLRVTGDLGLMDLDVYVLRPNAIEYTTSGKPMRSRMRARLVTGELAPDVLARVRTFSRSAGEAAAPDPGTGPRTGVPRRSSFDSHGPPGTFDKE